MRKAYDAVLYGLAWCAGLLIAAMMGVITLDVAVRNLGFQSSGHFFTFTEYALLLVPCLGAPWLVRERGHVYVEILLMVLEPRRRAVLRIAIGVVCIVVCSVLAWYGFDLTIRDYLGNEKDVRSLDMPRWMLVAFVPLSFAMMAIEFLRFLLRREDFLGSLTMQKE
jgi:C4-dicarboxylate transporter, DctQ subunit